MAKKRKRSLPIVESDDEFDENQIPSDNDMDTNKEENPQCQSNISAEENLEVFGLTSEDFDPTSNLQINTKKKRSSHPIWGMYGILQKHGKMIEKAKDRIFCVRCFAGKKIKR